MILHAPPHNSSLFPVHGLSHPVALSGMYCVVLPQKHSLPFYNREIFTAELYINKHKSIIRLELFQNINYISFEGCVTQ